MQFPLATGNVLASRYLVERLLGAGGMSVVAVATDLTEGQRVAIKMLLPEAARSEAVIKRFQREQRTLQQLSSPHTVRLLGSGTEGGYPYMVLEYLEGSDLSDVLKMQGALPMLEAAEHVLHACEAIAEAHSLGITHRDLKPGNMFMIRQPNGSACIKVLDFGISKLHETARQGESTLTGTAALLGSPFYMSPEQLISSRDVDARTDIWSLGVTLHELLTSTLPFGAKTTEKVCQRILNDLPTPLRKFRPDMPQALEEVILRCLKRRPAERYANIADFALELAPFAPPAAGRESLIAISDFLEPTKRVKFKAVLGHEERGSAPGRLASLPRVPLQGQLGAQPKVSAGPSRGAAAVPGGAGNLMGPPMAASGGDGGDQSETTAILTMTAAAAASAAVRGTPPVAGAVVLSQPGAGPPPPSSSRPVVAQPSASTEPGPLISVHGHAGAAGAGAAATSDDPATLHVAHRFWPSGAWIASASALAVVTFALGLGIGIAVGSSDPPTTPAASGAASGEPGGAASRGPKAARETQELDEGLDPIPIEPTGEAATASGARPVPGVAATSKPGGGSTVAKPPSPISTAWPGSTDPGGARPPAATGVPKPPAPTATAPAAPGVSEPPEF